jgi:hypothetical protein
MSKLQTTDPFAEDCEWAKIDFEREAEWRHEKATQYPNDPRNKKAAALLDRLAATVPEIQACQLVAA